MQESARAVRDVVAGLAGLQVGDRFEVAPATYARHPWTPDSEALLLRDDVRLSQEQTLPLGRGEEGPLATTGQ